MNKKCSITVEINEVDYPVKNQFRDFLYSLTELQKDYPSIDIISKNNRLTLVFYDDIEEKFYYGDIDETRLDKHVLGKITEEHY